MSLRAAVVYVTLSLLSGACVSAGKVRADSQVIQSEIDRARRSGAMRCAPADLALAEANLEFASAELTEGSPTRASAHMATARDSIKRALERSKGCAPKPVVIREKAPEVVKIQETDADGDGILDKDDRCVNHPEDKDGFADADGCPDVDDDADGVLDSSDKCPAVAGPVENQGCPAEAPKDKDGDTIADSVDRCVDQPEDVDTFQDEDGCPDPDNDGDGMLDSADRCPLQAGPPQNVGCPIVDKDGDGVNDETDRCPLEPEDVDTFQDTDGCPDLDNDSDGLVDASDRCPLEAGLIENNGCPDKDSDGDGIADRLDKCPDEHGVKEEEGCPKKYKMVVVRKDRIEIKQQTKFKTGSAKIIGRESFNTLNEVAQALRDNPQIKRIRIEGHTDSVGNDATNLRLSQSRADAVQAELLKYGVDPGRMESVGFGEARPIASNARASGRAENRRTEFNIVDPAPTP